jgi:hypothetical protein
MRGSLLEKLGTLVRTGVLGLWMLGVVLPMFWVLATSLKSTKEVTRSPFGIPDALVHPGAKTFAVIAENYSKAWIGSGFSAYFWNSLKVVSISLALILLLGSTGPHEVPATAWQPFRPMGGDHELSQPHSLYRSGRRPDWQRQVCNRVRACGDARRRHDAAL